MDKISIIGIATVAAASALIAGSIYYLRRRVIITTEIVEPIESHYYEIPEADEYFTPSNGGSSISRIRPSAPPAEWNNGDDENSEDEYDAADVAEF